MPIAYWILARGHLVRHDGLADGLADCGRHGWREERGEGVSRAAVDETSSGNVLVLRSNGRWCVRAFSPITNWTWHATSQSIDANQLMRALARPPAAFALRPST